MSDDQHDRIETARLILRPPVYSDAEPLQALLNDPVYARFSPHRPFDKATMHFAIADWREARARGVRVFVVSARDRIKEPIGLFHVAPDGEVGGGIAPQHSGRGVAVEAALAMRSALGLRTAWTIIDADHVDLIRFLEKIGYVAERRLPAHRVHPRLSDQPRDCVLMRRGSA